jgi:hypothetical protein
VKIEHITYQVPANALTIWQTPEKGRRDPAGEFMEALGFVEVTPDSAEALSLSVNQMVRWWQDADGTQIHLISDDEKIGPTSLNLGHFCVYVSRSRYDDLKSYEFCTRAREDSNRIWLEHPNGLRVEVREYAVGPKDVEEPKPELLDETYGYAETPIQEQVDILIKAIKIYGKRNETYKDNWRRFGWRGCVFRLRERAERAFDGLWDADHRYNSQSDSIRAIEDDLYDLINFAAFTIRAIRESNRDGSWF